MMKKTYYLPFLLLLSVHCNQPDHSKHQEANSTAILFEPANEKTACLLSQISYCTHTDSVLSAMLPGWKIDWEGKEAGGNEAFVAGNGRICFLVIRGSLVNFSWAAFQNWIYQDLNVASQEKWVYTEDSLPAHIASGAYSGWQNLCAMKDKNSGETLLQFLENKMKNVPLLVTGHSLGGNLATVFASYLFNIRKKENKTVPLINVITFAAPAAGDLSFASDFDQKFPASLRVENSNDIVPKFPSPAGIASLGNLFNDSLSAGKIMVGYKNLDVSLKRVFGFFRTALDVLAFTNVISPYAQTNGSGKQLSVPFSGLNRGNDVMNWLKEAGYQHSMAQYARGEGIAVIHCTE